MPPQSARERSDLTRQIKSILDGYPFGIAILRELLQNSDDAQAETQVFILDCRTHGTGSLFDSSLEECQGPSLLAVNDSVFKDPEDWEALQKIHGSNKVSDENMTGKYGLGFRANYHLTDNPHVLSGDRLYLTDPHERFPGALNGGGYFSLKEGDGVAYSDHFKAFQAAGIDPSASYINKTVVRLPLRTQDQARRSKICTTPTSIEDIRSLFNSFINDELGIVILFLKNIKHIELVEISEDGIRTVLGSASLTKRENMEISSEGGHYTSDTCLADYKVTISPTQPAQSSSWRIYHRSFSRAFASTVLSSKLHRPVEQLEEDLKRDKMVADVGMAYCLDPPSTGNGRLFTLLPLPQSISPNIPIHLNCNFALTSDRQHLKNLDHLDDETIQRHREGLLAHWNKAIFENFVPPTWAALATFLARDLRERGRLDSIWSTFPLDLVDVGSGRSYWEGLLGFVLGEIVQNNLEVFPVLGPAEAHPLRGAFIVDPRDELCPKEVLARLGLRVVAPPPQVYEYLKLSTPVLAPDSVANELRERVTILSDCPEEGKDAILGYLLSAVESDLNVMVGLPLIPLISGERISLALEPLTRIPVVRGLDDNAINGWVKLGIQFLDKRIPHRKLDHFGVSLGDDVGYFMKCIDSSKAQQLTSEDWDVIRNSLVNLRTAPVLKDDELEIYKELPLFPILENAPEGEIEDSAVSFTRWGPIQSNYVFAQSIPSCPIPSLPSTTTFVDAGIEKALRRHLDNSSSPVLGELDLLKMALDNWEFQPMHLQQRFLPRILSRLADMPSCVEILRNLPFIPVGDGILPPRDVVDPDSPMAGLYDDNGLPTGSFSKDSPLLHLCRVHGLLCQTLTAERLKDRVQSIATNAPTSLPKAARLLEMLETTWDSSFGNVIDDCKSLSWVPGEDNSLLSPDSCFFNDFPNHYEPAGPFGNPVNSSVSPSLARKIKIPFLSSLKIADKEDDDDEDDQDGMSVELLSRIQAVLHDYDIKYAINEFLANAHDAGATEFSMLLDMSGYSMGEGELPLSPSFPKLLSQPALILYNNAKFTEKDFKGILQIDKGGKLDNPDAIGRYGLGALSLFYFTDVVTIVSGEHILIMDPSAEHLPHTKKGKKRTALRRTLKSFYRDSPSYLQPFHGKYNFQVTQDFSYDGTMFRLPLLRGSSLSMTTQAIEANTCTGLLMQYQDLARSAPLFTTFNYINAFRAERTGSLTLLWEVMATRKVHSDGPTRVTELTISPNEETWFVGQSKVSVPKEFEMQLPYRLKLRDSFTIDIAFSKKGFKKDHSLFSVLRLPSPISIPCHLNAPFSLPSSRRGIHFDPAGDSNRDSSIGDTGWNRWILSAAFPPLYTHVLSILKDDNLIDILDFFPSRNPINNVSREIFQGFYDHLRQSPLPIFLTVSNTWISYNSAIFLSALPDKVNRPHIERMLRFIQPKDVVLLPPFMRRHLNFVPFAEATAKAVPSRVFTPKMLREVLLSNPSRIESRYAHGKVQTELWTTLQLLLTSGQSVSGLPLLLTGPEEGPVLRLFPQVGGPTIYKVDDPLRSILARLVGWEAIIHSSIPSSCAELMSQASPPLITTFNEAQAVALVRKRLQKVAVADHTSDTTTWIQLFWELFEHMPGLRTTSDLRPYPLIPTLQPNRYVSLSSCIGGDRVLVCNPSDIPQDLLVALQEYGFAIVDQRSHSHMMSLLGFTYSRLSLTSVLRGLQVLQRTKGNFLGVRGHESLAKWIRTMCSRETIKSKGLVYQTLVNLPIWPAMQGGKRGLHSARDVYYLPLNVRLFDSEILARYVGPSYAICEPISSMTMTQLKGKEMNLALLLEGLNLPSVLPIQLLQSYAAFLNELRGFRELDKHIDSLLLPDGSGNMKPIRSFYSSAESLFVQSFGADNKDKFIHPLIRSTLDNTYSLKFIRDVTPATLLECLRAVDDSVRNADNIVYALLERARRVYNRFTSYAFNSPRSMANTLHYSQIQSLKFVVRNNARTTRATYDVQPYVGPTTSRHLPLILSPSQVLRPAFESIAWTQRGVITEAPQHLLDIMPSFGAPTVREVALHLCVLVEIARDHAGNRSLLQDLQDTYSWLNENLKDEDSVSVSRSWSGLKPFLNVDDPTTEGWKWNSAEEIILNLHVDRPEHRIFGNRQFLEQYRTLLLRVGCYEMKDIPFNVINTQEILVLPPIFNTMRQSLQCTDMELVPEEEEGIAPDLQHLYCHRMILEAAVPHLRSSLHSGLLESVEDSNNAIKRYKIFGSRYCAAKLLEFIYTNKITTTKAHKEDLDTLLSELLALLSIADQWELEALKTEIGRIIVDELKLLDILNYKQIREQAEMYHARALLLVCREFERKNAHTIKNWERAN